MLTVLVLICARLAAFLLFALLIVLCIRKVIRGISEGV
tara:strand:- start:542 stop:655 length:114 start_codon:yes stop_codon:yes gene_type:complete